MELNSLPLWAQQIGAILVTIGTAIALTWAERRKRSDEPKPVTGSGEREVVAASFVGTRQMEDAITILRALHTTMNEVRDHLEKINERAHEDELVRAAVAKIKEDRG